MPTQFIAGVDEAGRGPLAGPVVAAAVILNPKKRIPGIKDSKQLTENQREALYQKIIASCLCYGIGRSEIHEIDTINILQATLLAMRRAILNLSIAPTLVLVDGNQLPNIPFAAKAIVRGDQTIEAISSASILAKVTRDREMRVLDKQYPGYDFANNKGYTTPLHVRALTELGACDVHRTSFALVKKHLQKA